MNSSIQNLTSLKPMVSPQFGIGQAQPVPSGEVNFSDLLMNSLSQTNGLQNQAQMAIGQSISGEDISQVEVMTAVKKADLSLRMLMSVRNKVVEALSEIKQMQM